jgi:hypothetical protein
MGVGLRLPRQGLWGHLIVQGRQLLNAKNGIAFSFQGVPSILPGVSTVTQGLKSPNWDGVDAMSAEYAGVPKSTQ